MSESQRDNLVAEVTKRLVVEVRRDMRSDDRFTGISDDDLDEFILPVARYHARRYVESIQGMIDAVNTIPIEE
jgi:hypothetical protein